jgi:hypothetical protein
MENISTSDNSYLNNYNAFETILNIERKYGNSDFNEIRKGLTAEVGKNFFSYLKNFNLSNDPHLLILPPNNHYYFDKKELRSVRTIINLKNLNAIKDLDTFLSTLTQILPPTVNFLGYFSYNKITLKGEGLLLGLSARLNNLLDSRTDHNMNKKELSDRLQKFGFKIIDMTELDGLTYFYSQKVCQPARIRA